MPGLRCCWRRPAPSPPARPRPPRPPSGCRNKTSKPARASTRPARTKASKKPRPKPTRSPPGTPRWGLTTFELNQSGGEPEGAPLTRVRADLPPGLAANPQAPPKQCSNKAFQEDKCPAESNVGETELKVHLLGPLELT